MVAPVLPPPSKAWQFDTLPPHSLEAEVATLGSMLVCREDAKLFEMIRSELRQDHFFNPDHGIIFAVMCAMSDAGVPVDGLTVREELLKRQLLSEVGGIDYLAKLLTSMPTAVHGPSYARTVHEKAGLRKLIEVANDILARCYGPLHSQDPIAEICTSVDERMTELLSGASADEVYTLADAIEEVIQAKKNGVEERVPTGQKGLDQIIGGLPLGGMVLIGGRPGMGKSQQLKQLVLNYAKRGRRCGIVSLEETRQKIARNMISNQSGVENSRIAYGEIGEVDWREIEAALPDLKKLSIFINDSASVWSEVAKALTRLVVKHHCDVIAVDYLQLVSDDDPGADRTAEQEVAKVCKGLKRLFKKFGVIGMAAVQLNRGGEQGQREPELRDLRQSGQLEQDGDVILLLHRDDYYRYKEPNFVPTKSVKIIVAKNKDGSVGSVDLYFDGARQSITDGPSVDPFGVPQAKAHAAAWGGNDLDF